MLAWFRLKRLDPRLALAQYGELQQQVPLLYLLLTLNTLAVSYTHLGLAPSWLTIWIPGGLVVVSLGRLVVWRRRAADAIPADQAIGFLRRVTVLGVLLASTFTFWALSLAQYGAYREQAHVAMYIAITVIGCIFCLFPLPQAAFATTVTVTGPYLVYYMSLGDPAYAAISINILLVTLVMMRVLFNHHRTFAEMVRLNGTVTALSRIDPLTGLSNRRHFFSELEQRMASDPLGQATLVVGVLDLDRFKAVNDTYGHSVGDSLLCQVAGRLRESFLERGLITRLGGDEFAFLTDLAEAEAMKLAEDACEALAVPFDLDGLPVSIGATCGLAVRGDLLNGASSLYAAADYALYVGKADRRGLATSYSPEHARQLRFEREMEAAFQGADLDRELHLVLQPIVSGPDGLVTAVEALARWNSPIIGPVSPARFIPLAERTGLIHRMTLLLFDKALACAEQLPAGIKLSFNLSAHDLTSPATMVGLLAMIRRSPVVPGNLVMELTETALLRDFDAAEASISMLRAAGVRIALDDFGTGYSSLEYLRRLPIDKIKIDRGFVADMDKPGGRDLLAGIFALCNQMRIKCIAEGVEDEAQFRTLRDLGCPAFQGYHFARPMPVDAFLRWHDDRNGANGSGPRSVTRAASS